MIRKLQVLIQAGYPIIWINSADERRVVQAIDQVAEALDWGRMLWSIAGGFMTVAGEPTQNVLDPQEAVGAVAAWQSRCVFVLRDFHHFISLDNPANIPVIRTLRDVAALLKKAPRSEQRCIVCTGPSVDLPEDLQQDVVLLDWPLPDEQEIAATIDAVIDNADLTVGERASLYQAARGLSQGQIEDACAASIVGTGELSAKEIASAKAQAVAQSGALTWIDPGMTLNDVGGLDVFKAWLASRAAGFSPAAQAYNLPLPKGVMLTGIAGTGKSLSAQVAAIVLGVPLLRLDMGAVFGGLVGESESNVRNALAVVGAIGRCVLWLDEIEKGFAGSGASSGSTDGGVGTRVMGTILTWMQEQQGAFVFATANDVSALPPELTRKGRFDEVFFVDLPNSEEREAIWKVHIDRRRVAKREIDYRALAKWSRGYTGAEIEAAVIEARYRVFNVARDDDPTEPEYVDALSASVPLAKSSSAVVDSLRSWAKSSARFASSAETDASDSNRFANLKPSKR